MRLALASKSEARRAMLDAAGIAYDVVESRLDEDDVKASLRARGLDAPGLAVALAEAKALAADHRFVLGADQTLELDDGVMLDKPVSRDDAAAQLRRMSGRAHRLHSAAAIAEDGAIGWRAVESARLAMRPLSDAFIADFLDAEWDAVRCGVGGYRIEGRGAQLFAGIEGSHFVILGLPLLALLAELRRRGLLAS